MSDSAVRIFLRGSFVSLLGTGVLGIVNYFVRRSLSLQLAETDYGAFYSAFALLSLIYGFCDLGMTQSATALIAKYAGTPLRDRFFKAHLIFCFLVAGAASLFVLIFAGAISEKYLGITTCAPLLILGGMFFVQALEGAFRSFWCGLKRFLALQIFAVISGVILLSGVLTFGRSGSLAAVCFCFLVPPVVITAAEFFYSRKAERVSLRGKITPAVWKELFSLCGWLALSTTLFSMLYYTDTVMLTSLRGVESSAKYNIALPIMQIVQAFMVFPNVMLPVAMDMVKKGDLHGIRRFFLCALLLAAAAAPVCFVFFHCAAPLLIKILFSGKYLAAAPAVPLLCTGMVFYTLGHFFIQILICLKRSGAIAGISAVCFMSNLILNWFFIRKWDFTGAAAATLGSYFLFALIAAVVLGRVIFHRKENAIRV